MERFLHSKYFANPSWAVDNESWVPDFQEYYISLGGWSKNIKYVAGDSGWAGRFRSCPNVQPPSQARRTPRARACRNRAGDCEVGNPGRGASEARAIEKAARRPLTGLAKQPEPLLQAGAQMSPQ